MTEPETGITVQAHVVRMLEEAALTIAAVRVRVEQEKKLKKAECAELRRRLAGVLGQVEAVRIWADRGAPRE